MATCETILFKNCALHWSRDRIKEIPRSTRGIYVLFSRKQDYMNVVYIGMSRGVLKSGVRGRVDRHAKAKDFTHFSVYEVWDNISERQVEELEGLFRQIYAKDEDANSLNKAKGYAPLLRTRRERKDEWLHTSLAVKSRQPPKPRIRLRDLKGST